MLAIHHSVAMNVPRDIPHLLRCVVKLMVLNSILHAKTLINSRHFAVSLYVKSLTDDALRDCFY